MAEVITPDICVIGAGSGGLSVAAAAAAFGVPVVLIEQGRMGGECLNSGCVPSKALIAAARRVHGATGLDAFGITTSPPQIDFARVHEHVHRVIAAIAPNDSRERFNGLGVRVVAGKARFKDKDTVAVGDDIEIKARRVVIATGSSPAIPAIPGLAMAPFLTNETVFDLKACPQHLIVLGGGPIGLELGQAFRRLGAHVTVLDADKALAREDVECARIVLDALVQEGIVLRQGVSVARVETGAAGVAVVLGGTGNYERITGSDLLVATGRRANSDGLNLEAAGIAHTAAGITVDRGMRTSNRRVYAIGDVAGGQQHFTHAANYHAGLVIRNALFRLPVKADDRLIPRVTFTDPELAHVGLSEQEARGAAKTIRILRWPFAENDRAQAERTTRGHIKVVTDKRGRILGATIVGPGAGELITPWTLALANRLNIRALAGMVVPYPTFGEVGKRAAISYFLPSLTSPFVRRIIGWLRRLG
ncbi:MAG: FAD-dependent oxidoreductase [Xanthobacteraceae bacterium]|nr:FAD-dependent oxidoreductase [Xanthobacteraceae bacterium]